MFVEVLRSQWKASLVTMSIVAVAAFALPLVSVQPAGEASLSVYNTVFIMEELARYSQWFGGLALATGLLAAVIAWGNDHRVKHVYPLILPVPRWYYALLRFTAGLVILTLPLAALWVGSMIAAFAATVPVGLSTYPHALSLRFAIASLLAYSIFFAISASTTRTAAYVLVIAGIVVVGQVGVGILGVDADVMGEFFRRLTVWPGPFEIFTGRWVLIDV